MNVVLNILVGVQMLTALTMIGLILIQHGKGADMGAAFGSGSAGSLFGASGSANFLSRTTAVLAAVFFVCTLLLAYFSHARPAGGGSLLERAAVGVPAAPASAPASQIPSGAAPTAPAASAPAVPASGASQIPGK
ncbi:preprotein translocase subunit SecG [Variovorax ginsengisoli]|uniref:Protein-export membrane protein SecG n=1 Tax=Variovorax ginsengisoli TaxID=363844 RepID=A0ABT9SDM1_9BURK|nr:preprotein translocase subunit SecG [Variovorax ginsengisoli]MDP9901487.1 preprotein translocase subunit SecG [Variovorax ginsengisoli]